MRFYVNIWNHGPNPLGAINYFKYIRNGLVQAEQSVCLAAELNPDREGVNILLEKFTPDLAEALVASHHDRGLRYIVLATELLAGGTFNGVGQDASTANCTNRSYLQERYDAFCKVAEVADAIWIVSEHQRPGYEQRFPNHRILTMPMCFDPIEAGHEREICPPKIYEALFLGSATQIRKDLLEVLGQRVAVFHPHQLHAFAVPSVVRSSRVCLHLNLKHGWPYTSIMRHHVLLTYGGYIVAEESSEPGELDEFVEIVPRSEYVDTVARRVRDPGLPDRTADARQRYERARPMGPAFRKLVDASR